MPKQEVGEITGTEAVLIVTKTLFGQETEDREHMEIRPFATVPAKVRVDLSRTINLGNYESARVAVAIELPCYREEVAAVYPKLFEQVADRLSTEVSRLVPRRMDTEQSVEELL